MFIAAQVDGVVGKGGSRKSAAISTYHSICITTNKLASPRPIRRAEIKTGISLKSSRTRRTIYLIYVQPYANQTPSIGLFRILLDSPSVVQEVHNPAGYSIHERQL